MSSTNPQNQVLGAFASLALAFTMTTAARAQSPSEWHNVGPLVSGDVNATVSFQVEDSVPTGDVWNGGTPEGPASYQVDAKPFWINIQRPGLNGNDRVHVQLISYVKDCYRGDCQNTQTVQELDLQYAELGRFTGDLDGVTLDYQLNDGYAVSSRTAYAHELVIWVDGQLYKAVDGTNLKLDLRQ